jgi:hypothetical protein
MVDTRRRTRDRHRSVFVAVSGQLFGPLRSGSHGLRKCGQRQFAAAVDQAISLVVVPSPKTKPYLPTLNGQSLDPFNEATP